MSQGPVETERKLKTKLNKSSCRGKNVYCPEEILTLYNDATHPTIPSMAVRHRASHRGVTYPDVMDLDQHEVDVVPARTTTLQLGCAEKPLQTIHPDALL